MGGELDSGHRLGTPVSLQNFESQADIFSHLFPSLDSLGFVQALITIGSFPSS